jgi:hypothetical protein
LKLQLADLADTDPAQDPAATDGVEVALKV